MSIANDIALELSERLEAITTANGYNTDIGARILRGRRRLDPAAMPCVVIIENPDLVLNRVSKGTLVKLRHAFVIEGHMECDPDNPNDAGHLMVADIKRAIFSKAVDVHDAQNRIVTMEYAGRTIAPREDGMNFAAAGVEINVEYAEDLAAP